MSCWILAAYSGYVPTPGPGDYTPDLVNTVPDGRPRTSGEVMGRVLDPSPYEFKAPEQVFAEVNIPSIAHSRHLPGVHAPFDATTRSHSQRRPKTVPTSPVKSFAPHSTAKL